MLRAAVIDDLKILSPKDFVSKHIFDRSPIAFASRDDFVKWKTNLSKDIEVDAASITIVGSSAIGLSLNPNKNFKLFDHNSDIDVAVISNFHFHAAWRYLRNNGHTRHKLTQKQKNAWDEHERKLIYWGTIAADKLLPLFPFASKWLPAVSRASSPLVGDRDVKLRIYADYESLRSYQVQSIKAVKQNLLTGKVGV